MDNRFKLGAALLAAAGTFAFAGTAPANAAACPGGSLGLGTLTAGFNCTQGGFTFTFTSLSGFSAADTISFSNPAANQFNYSIQKDIPWTSGSKVFNYTVAAPSGKVLTDYTALPASAVFGAKTGQFVVLGAAGPATGKTLNNTNTMGVVSYTGTLPTSDTFTATLDNLSGLGIETLQSSYVVADAPPTPAVPGPLPIFGAAAAFGFSRKVRNRIKAAA
jgi:hypothetical protein